MDLESRSLGRKRCCENERIREWRAWRDRVDDLQGFVRGGVFEGSIGEIRTFASVVDRE